LNYAPDESKLATCHHFSFLLFPLFCQGNVDVTTRNFVSVDIFFTRVRFKKQIQLPIF